VHALLTAGISSGEVVPLPLNKFSRKEAVNAFRYMATGARHSSPFACHTLYV
jgi:fatty acid synthase